MTRIHTVSIRAEREILADDSADGGSFSPSKKTASRNTSQAMGYILGEMSQTPVNIQ
jgi:hypothetical protein